MLRHLRISTILFLTFGLLWSSNRPDFSEGFHWPLELDKQLSSGFGDYRPGRFHAGIDLRTNQQEGARVLAPEDGSVWRIKISYRGYGKGLYIRGKSGRIYVFGHLQTFNKEIGSYLRRKQRASERYYQDLYPERGEIPVYSGKFIARSGQTGAGAPHLHFEVRTEDDKPTNPLYYPINFADTTPPGFDALWLEYVDSSTLFLNGQREFQLKPVSLTGKGQYTVNDTLVVRGPFRVKAAVSDFLHQGSFILGPSKISLFVDDTLYHEVEYDQLDFADGMYSDLDRDKSSAKDTFKHVYNLYRSAGNRLSNYRDKDGGVFSASSSGNHRFRIEASDPFGNIGTIRFTVFYHPFPAILADLNTGQVSDSIFRLPFAANVSEEGFDSVAVRRIMATGSFADLGAQITTQNDMLVVRGEMPGSSYVIDFYFQRHLVDRCYLGLSDRKPSGEDVISNAEFTLADNGIVFHAHSDIANWLIAEIQTDVGFDKVVLARHEQHRFSYYYRPDTTVSDIERVVFRGPIGYRPDTLVTSIYQAINGADCVAHLKPGIALRFDPVDVYDRALLHVRDTAVAIPQGGYYSRQPFVLESSASAFAGWAELFSGVPPEDDPRKLGLYVHDEKKGWLWAGGVYDSSEGFLISDLGGPGVVAIIADTAAPKLYDFNLADGEAIPSSRPYITFTVDDDLSDIEDDRNFLVTLDGTWLVPEYDPERKHFKTRPDWRLDPGPHTIQIEVTDRCGNKVQTTRSFIVHSGLKGKTTW